jgi:hypothetical protein
MKQAAAQADQTPETNSDSSSDSHSDRGTETGSRSSIWRAASVFFSTGLLAGFGNYGFQILASEALSKAEYANLNGWFADMSWLFIISGVVQYFALFSPSRPVPLRRSVLAINGCCLVLVGFWWLAGPGQNLARTLIIFLAATLSAWISGQILYRKMLQTLGLANLLASFGKLALVLLPLSVSVEEKYRFALFANYLPALWLISVNIWKAPETSEPMESPPWSWQLFAAPIVLSISGAMIPNMDTSLLQRLQSAEPFQSFVRASLFSRGVYFFFLIFAQLILPYQIRRELQALRQLLMSFWVVLAAFLVSMLVAAVAPWVVQHILRWEQVPQVTLIFLSCLNMSTLIVLLLLIQQCCAQSQARTGAVLLAVLAAGRATQFFLDWSINGYLVSLIGLQTLLIFTVTRSLAHLEAARETARAI